MADPDAGPAEPVRGAGVKSSHPATVSEEIHRSCRPLGISEKDHSEGSWTRRGHLWRQSDQREEQQSPQSLSDKDERYVANGDIGVVTGHRRTRQRDWKPVEIEVELAAQPGYSYKYRPGEFDGQESTPPLELAYALTVHKTQGSEFLTTFLVVQNPCRMLSRRCFIRR